jgi:hypothetical protein
MECSALDFGCHFSWLLGQLSELWLYLFDLVLQGMIAILSLIPVPSWATSTTLSLPDGVLWFAAALELPYGISVMTGAWVTRFIIRRLPVIG